MRQADPAGLLPASFQPDVKPSGGRIMTVIWVLLGLVVVAVIWGISIYNRLVRLKTQVANGWSQIDVQLKRRYDLIPNLVETVKGYAKHERETLFRTWSRA
jgi:hypothetical protein